MAAFDGISDLSLANAPTVIRRLFDLFDTSAMVFAVTEPSKSRFRSSRTDRDSRGSPSSRMDI